MSVICSMAAAVGMTLQMCQAPADVPVPDFGRSDAGSLEFRKPPAAPPPAPVPGRLSVFPDSHHFGDVVPGRMAKAEFRLRNTGEKPVRVAAVLVGMESGMRFGAFKLADDGCSGKDVRPGEDCRVGVAFEAAAGEEAGAVQGTLAVAHDGPDGSLKVRLAANGAPLPKPKPAPKPMAWPEPPRDLDAEAAARILAERRARSWEDQDDSPEAMRLSGKPAPAPAKIRYTDKGYGHSSVKSTLPVDNLRTITTVRKIHGVVETGINSQVAGEQGGKMLIQVSRDVFAPGTDILQIPKGSWLDCTYESLEKQGDSRLPVVCKRVLRAEDFTELFEISAPVGDTMGRAGVPGEIDNRIWERYGTAVIVAAVGAVAAAGSQAMSSQNSAIGASGNQLAQNFGEISAKILEQSVNLAPIITISQGTRVVIIPANDWILKQPEPEARKAG